MWHGALLTEVTPVAPLLTKPCQVSPIQRPTVTSCHGLPVVGRLVAGNQNRVSAEPEPLLNTQHTKCMGMCSLNACHVLKGRGSLLRQNCSTVCWESLVEAVEPHHLTGETDYGFLNSNNTLYSWPWVKEWSRNNFNPSVNPDFVLLVFQNCKQGPLQKGLDLAHWVWQQACDGGRRESSVQRQISVPGNEAHLPPTTLPPPQSSTACLSQDIGCWYMHSRTWPAVSSISMETTSSSMVAWWRYVDSKIRTHFVKCIKKE